MRSILHIEDNLAERELVKRIFFDQRIVHTSSNKESIELLDKQNFDLILLDVMLEDGDSYELCRKIKNDPRHAQVPIIMISGKDEVSDKILGLDVGADDYVSKPYNFLELKARTQALLRRANSNQTSTRKVNFGPFEMEPDVFQFFISIENEKKKVSLSSTEFKLLHYLMKNAGRIISREQILDSVWGQEIHVTDRTVDAKISKIRKKLGDHGDWLTSIYGLGYSLNKPERNNKVAA